MGWIDKATIISNKVSAAILNSRSNATFAYLVRNMDVGFELFKTS